VLLQNEETDLCWVVRKSKLLKHRSVPEFLGINDRNLGLIFPQDELTPEQLFDKYPVDVIIDFSSADAILTYGKEKAKKGVAIVTAISAYPGETVTFLKKLSWKTRVLWSPNITVGINFLMLAAKILKNIAPYTNIEIIEEHFKNKKRFPVQL
jgi:4-hydroxy-tetrahydrodipicolinate reductase